MLYVDCSIWVWLSSYRYCILGNVLFIIVGKPYVYRKAGENIQRPDKELARTQLADRTVN